VADVLHDWDGQFSPGSRAASVFTLYLRNAVDLLFLEIGDKTLIDRLLHTEEFLDSLLRIVEEVSRMPNQN